MWLKLLRLRSGTRSRFKITTFASYRQDDNTASWESQFSNSESETWWSWLNNVTSILLWSFHLCNIISICRWSSPTRVIPVSKSHFVDLPVTCAWRVSWSPEHVTFSHVIFDHRASSSTRVEEVEAPRSWIPQPAWLVFQQWIRHSSSRSSSGRAGSPPRHTSS